MNLEIGKIKLRSFGALMKIFLIQGDVKNKAPQVIRNLHHLHLWTQPRGLINHYPVTLTASVETTELTIPL